ncbi:unnamed protein product [Mytilus edulis]|uniref:Senataxin n=1 Tax=Mytilus edulis TaxID=6550 RepID=A0A8S3TN74_MYTED|nr:unnamed protein product [Mytilus edulis]
MKEVVRNVNLMRKKKGKMDKENEFLGITPQLDCSSTSKNTAIVLLSKVETSNNATEDNLPILTRPRRSFIRSGKSENNVIPVSGLKEEFQEDHNRTENTGSTRDRLIEVVVDIDHTTQENSYNVSTQCDIIPDLDIDSSNIRTDKISSCSRNFDQIDTPSCSRNFDQIDTPNAVGLCVEENVFHNDSVTTISSDSLEKQNIEENNCEEVKSESETGENGYIQMLDDSFPIPLIFDDQDTGVVSCTYVECIDGISHVLGNEETLQEAGQIKENAHTKTVTTSETGSFIKNRTQREGNDFWNQNHFFHNVLFWKAVWFEEYEICKKTPPDISEGVSYLSSFYARPEDYFNTILQHLLLETWESCLQTLQTTKENRPSAKCVFYRPEGHCDVFRYDYVTVKDNIFNKGDLLLSSLKSNGERKTSLCYVEEINEKQPTRSMPSIQTYSNDDQRASSSERVSLIELKLKSKYRPDDRIKESNLEFVISLNDVLVLYNGLATLFETKLCPHVLQPGDSNVFTNMSTQRKKEEFNDMIDKEDFNHLQKTAILNAADMVTTTNTSNRIGIIQGHFGTGKTNTIIGIIKEICKGLSDGKCSIGICAPSHMAVENLMKKLISAKKRMERKKNGANIQLVLIGDDTKYQSDVQNYSLKTRLKTEKKHQSQPAASTISNKTKYLDTDIISSIEESSNDTGVYIRDEEEKRKLSILCRSNIVCGTFRSFGDPFFLNAFSSVNNTCRDSKLTCLILDEAQQATELETLLPLQSGTNKLILVGDPKQLQPTVKSQISKENGFGTSMYERFCDHFRLQGNEKINPVLVLDTQCRSHPEIEKFPHEIFYGSQSNTHSAHNITAVNMTISLCECIYNFVHKTTRLTHKDIGIISSVDHINEIKEGLVNRTFSNVDVDTVTGFQGRSKEVVILTCSTDDIEKNEFLSCKNVLNVALTRARSGFFIVGNFDTLSEKNKYLQKLVADARDRRVLRVVKDGDIISNTVFSACLSSRGQKNTTLI